MHWLHPVGNFKKIVLVVPEIKHTTEWDKTHVPTLCKSIQTKHCCRLGHCHHSTWMQVTMLYSGWKLTPQQGVAVRCCQVLRSWTCHTTTFHTLDTATCGLWSTPSHTCICQIINWSTPHVKSLAIWYICNG